MAALAAGTLVVAACGPSSSGSDAPADSTRDADAAPTWALAQRLIAQTDSTFRTVDLLTANEKSRLRQYLQPQHIERARRLGIDPVPDRRAAARLWTPQAEAPSAQRLFTNSYYIVDPSMSYAVPLVVPSTAHLLEHIGRRFQTELLGRGLPPYRFLLTNVLRSGQDQAALRGGNVNAAQGQSTHEYGTTFDIFYDWYQYAAVHDARTASAVARLDSAHRAEIDVTALRRALYSAYLDFGETYRSRIKAVLGRTVLAMQDDGLLLATYERRQPVYHLTLAREVEAPTQPFAPAAVLDSAQAGPPVP